MKDAPTRMLLAAATLVGVWIAVYWLWPSSQPPPITFDEIIVRPDPDPPAATTSAPSTKSPTVTNPLGSGLEPAPAPEFDTIIPPEFETHIVAAGETIWSIAAAKWGDQNLGGVIARANPIADPRRLRPGQTLLIPKDPRNIQGVPTDAPAPEPKPEITEYVVAPGDTLSQIAQRFYGRSSLWTRIRDANPAVISQTGDVRVGVTIIIPPPPG